MHEAARRAPGPAKTHALVGCVGVLLATGACSSSDSQGKIDIPDAVTQVGFLLPCFEDEGCDDKVCVPHIGTTVCSQACDATTQCPDPWSCWTPPSGSGEPGGRPPSYCVSPYWSLCRPCDSNADCASLTSESPGGCVDYLGEGAFCATSCDDADACPDGFVCADTVTLSGAPGRRCINATGMCPCTPYLHELGEPTRCVTSNDWGDCVGHRTCDTKEWSACDAREPAPDVPNLIDDDCDGVTDELVCACGDGVCDGACGETTAACPCDCAVEGDGVCSPCGESPLTSPVDCCRAPTGSVGCGDGFCMGFTCGENPASCPQDCGTPCGNDICEAGENPYNCPDDCAHKVCGNHVCESTDGGPEGCPQDCKPFCGDCICDPARDEAVFNCPIDCGYCGDGDCSPCAILGESVESCDSDCCLPSPEACNGIDDDCDEQTDEADAIGCTRFYRDADGDGLGWWAEAQCLCGPSGEYSARALGDCDDGDDDAGGGVAELCNGADDDCDGESDEGFDLGAACVAPGGACVEGRVACDGASATHCVDGAARVAGSLCAALRCEQGILRPPGTCDGAGACVELPPIDCDGYDCEETGTPPLATGRCLSQCASAADCRAGWACGIGGECEQVAADCKRDDACVDQDWATIDVCLVTCAHLTRDDETAGGDVDGDGVANGIDKCPETPDDQSDSDGDGRGDACDACGGPGQQELCNGGDDDCDGDTDEGFDVGLSCRTSDTSCDAGRIVCEPDGTATCQATGFAPAGIECGDASCGGGAMTLASRCDGAGVCKPGVSLSCHGYACSDDTCGTDCALPGDCLAGWYCEDGVCLPERGAGARCDSGVECADGQCVDGVCCTTPCDGACQICGDGGVCQPVAAGTDPDDECGACETCDAGGACAAVAGTDPKDACDIDPDAPCGSIGTCSSDGDCAQAESGVACGPAGCHQGQVADIFRCDGAGSCLGSDAVACPNSLACDDAGVGCKASCSEDQDCIAGHWCEVASGHCKLKAARGTSCLSDGECQTGVCADGVCCDWRCNGGCETCAAGATPGVCSPHPVKTDPESACSLCKTCDGNGACANVPIGQDPQSDCGDDATTCGTTGTCNGGGACAFEPATTVCGSPRCVGETSLSTRSCNGSGVCADAIATACVGGRCDPASGACKTSCTGDGDCQSGFFCGATATCKPRGGLGASCDSGGQCASAFCTDDVCCDRPCTGACQVCGGDGVCGPVADGSEEASCNGLFHCASGVCKKDDGVTCAAASECSSGLCEGNACCATTCAGVCDTCASGVCATADHAQVSGRCEGSKWCVDASCVAINGSSCAPGDACPGGLVCRAGVCAPPATLGTSCDDDGQCASDHCVDDVCCESTCTGECHACAANGRCEPVSTGGGPVTDTCAGGLECSSGGECRLPDGAVCGGPGECASGHCSDLVCCPEACDGVCESCASGSCVALAGDFPSEGCGVGEVCLGRDDCGSIGGGACSVPGDCTSNTCVIISGSLGFCCDSTCEGACETCSASEPLGTCEAVHGAENPGRCDNGKWCDPGGACVDKTGVACGDDSGCAPGTWCDLTAGPSCQPQLARGASCPADGACVSGLCADEHCCDRACDGACEYCDLPTGLGTCTLAPTGTSDPGCAADEVCSREQGGCALDAGEGCVDDLDCASDVCAHGVCCDQTCDGVCESCELGTCELVINDETSICLGPFVCDAAGACKQDPGTPCASGGQCSSGSCDAGTHVCCPANCSGACTSCALDGGCVTVQGAENPGRCADTSWCDGSGACAAKANAECSGDDCAPGFWCDRPGATGTCVPLEANGSACASQLECSSGFCVGNACCESACTGLCETCARAGRLGSCELTTPGDDPGERCGDGFACDALGACDAEIGESCTGQSDCLSGACVDNRCCESACAEACQRCDEPGHEGECRAIDGTNDGQCGPPQICDNGACLIASGQSCTLAAQCASGQCEGGVTLGSNVCCDTSCGGACKVCMSGSGDCVGLDHVEDFDSPSCVGASWCVAGSCRAKDGSDCASGSDCPMSYFCDTSAGAENAKCRAPRPVGGDCASDEQCQNGICSKGKCCASRCDAACASCSTGSCTFATVMTDPGDLFCPGAEVCGMDGNCKQPVGGACGVDASLCANNQCVDGVCCNTPCNGLCETCNASGTCVGVSGATDSGCNGQFECAGQGSCRLADGQACLGPSMCASNVCVANTCCASSCNIGQWCPLGECTDITASACASSSECPASFYCDMSGTCAARLGAGATCTNDVPDECQAGVCSHGVCCSSACDAPCGNCATGICTLPLSGTDPADACPGTEVCGTDGGCKRPLGASCMDLGASACLSNNCVDDVCCGSPCNGTCAQCDATGTCVGVTSGPDEACSGTFECAGLGMCRLADGQTCTNPSMCASNVCLGNTCCDSACGFDQWCPGGLCTDVSATMCVSETDCPPNAYCGVDGFCAPQLGLGASCEGMVSDECAASAVCSGGVCCSTTCDGECLECDNPMNLGHCQAVMDGVDACDAPGELCKGGFCRKPDGASCVTNSECSNNHCAFGNGMEGTCCASDCDAIMCGSCNEPGSEGMCLPGSGDAIDPDCQGPDFACDVGMCKRANGQPCGTGTECISGTCTNNTCCEGTCGSCQICNAGTDGTCADVSGGETMTCAAGMGLWCDASATCVARDGALCGPSVACAPGFVCDEGEGKCKAKVGDGGSCTLNSDCANGRCAFGTCCATTCDAARCESCNVAGHAGMCWPVTLAQDTTGPSCSGLDYCDVSGACKPLPSCAGDGECAPWGFCPMPGAVCQIKRGSGGTCTRVGECTSGICNSPPGTCQ